MIEVCSIAGWVCDLVRTLEIEMQVANTADERWRWRKVKRKEAKLASENELHRAFECGHESTCLQFSRLTRVASNRRVNQSTPDPLLTRPGFIEVERRARNSIQLSPKLE